MSKLGSKQVAREIEVEIWVDLSLVRNESDHPTEDGSSPGWTCYKKAMIPDFSTQQAPPGYNLLALLEKEVSKREYISPCLLVPKQGGDLGVHVVSSSSTWKMVYFGTRHDN